MTQLRNRHNYLATKKCANRKNETRTAPKCFQHTFNRAEPDQTECEREFVLHRLKCESTTGRKIECRVSVCREPKRRPRETPSGAKDRTLIQARANLCENTLLIDPKSMIFSTTFTSRAKLICIF